MYANFRKDQCERRSSSTPSKVTLIYFDIMARAESIRFILAAGGMEWEDKRVGLPFPVPDERWVQLKPKTPWGSIPVLEVDGKMVGQSIAICRMAARMAGLAGADSFEQALVESIGDYVTDIREEGIKVFLSKDEEKEEAKNKYLTEVLPKLLTGIETFSADYEGPFLVGKNMTWADLHFAAVMETQGKMIGDNSWEEKFPKLKTLCDSVRQSPNVAKYLAQRKETDF